MGGDGNGNGDGCGDGCVRQRQHYEFDLTNSKMLASLFWVVVVVAAAAICWLYIQNCNFPE